MISFVVPADSHPNRHGTHAFPRATSSIATQEPFASTRNLVLTMGVVTTVYSVPADLVRKIRKDNDLIGSVIDPEEGSTVQESFDFDSSVEAWVSVLRAADYVETAKNIDSEQFDTGLLDYDGYDMWLVPPSQVRSMLKELQPASWEQLRTAGLAAEVTDRRGTKLRESEYEGYFCILDQFKTFLEGAALHGHYLLFTEA